MPEIVDLNTYTRRMANGLMDKMFFVDKIASDVVIDFGCADGVLLEALHPWLPEAYLVGYDNDKRMILASRERLASDWSFVTDDWSQVLEVIDASRGKKVALVLSSIIHEIYHYQAPSKVEEFWRLVFETGFHFIIIRDMVPSRSIDRLSDITDVSRVYNKFIHTPQLEQFERIWGTISSNLQLVHFLLKYKYLEPNWEREVRENYLPLYSEDLLSMIPRRYGVTYHEHYVLPYLKGCIREDFGITLKDSVHLKLILERED